MFETSFLFLIVVAVLSYLLGSVPFGIVVSKLFGLPDPRGIGSGNIGATNVLRTGSKKAALLTVLLDAAKGLVAVLIAKGIFGFDAALVAALFSFIGHCFPVWLGFKGGKGVATLLGTLFGLSFVLGALACLAWLLTFLTFRISSLSAVAAAFATPVVALLIGYGNAVFILVIMSAMLLWRHRENIQRLRAGTEPRVNWSKS